MKILFREANTKDCEAVYLLNKYSMGYDDVTLEFVTRRMTYMLENTSDKIFVGEVDGKVVSYAHLHDLEATYREPLKELVILGVDEKLQGKGIGSQMLEYVETWAKNDGAHGINLVSGMTRDLAHKFYLKSGYTVRKEYKNFIKMF